MQLFCPACQAAFAGTQRCPRCAGLLLLPHEVAAESLNLRDLAGPPPEPTPFSRVVVGAVFALGLYLGLRKLAMGAVLAAHPEPDSWWTSFEGLTTVCGAQIAAVIFGAVLAAAGRVGGFVFGATVGGVCGGLFLAAELVAGAPVRDLVLYIQPLVLVAVGGIAGVFAARVWGAVPVLDMPIPVSQKLSSLCLTPDALVSTGRPTAWARIILGATLMVIAVAASDQLRLGMQRYSDGMLNVGSVGQAKFITWQFAVLGILTGGVIAGASTGAGIRHGLIAGAIGGVGVLGATALHGEALSPVNFWLGQLSLGELAPTAPAAVAAAVSGVLFLGFLGGWLGGALFQPLAPEHMRGRLKEGLY
ncbi:unnamed protein product [Gemmata massiliana]|uniref:Uncharacterized protein n=1 Tax=Gemmata massiliana TaxID=1210884 RepID=A0A6P2DKC0_9BACT|nr:hypothetical protein [Gemmata massiliana]VTS00863.1 unnamed protein product [Gemmata massiliana]